jgi:hypothetical protein
MKKNKDLNEVEYDATQDEAFDKRSVGEVIRDNDGKICGYKFKIYIRDSKPLEGTLTNEEMELIYREYSSDGANLTQRSISRHFPYTVSEFKKILRAFGVTKSVVPFPPHILESRSTEDLIELHIKQKEVDFLKRYEQDKGDLYKKKYNELLLEHQKLKEDFESAKYIVEESDKEIFDTVKLDSSNNTLLIYLSDMHIGAYVSNEGVYDNEYDENEVHRRLSIVLNKVNSYKGVFENIIVLNLGDAIDGYDSQTTRSESTHILPQNMSNKEQGQVLLRQMSGFFTNLKNNNPKSNIFFVSVGHSNHGGDFEHSIITALAIMLEHEGITSYVSVRPIDHFVIGTKTFIYLHGKDNSDQFKNFPLVLNDRTELYLDEYIKYHGLEGDIIVVKGDLHQSAVTYGKSFKYKSVSSLFGSSNWMHANFGFTKWGCDYTIIDESGDMLDGIIRD